MSAQGKNHAAQNAEGIALTEARTGALRLSWHFMARQRTRFKPRDKPHAMNFRLGCSSLRPTGAVRARLSSTLTFDPKPAHRVAGRVARRCRCTDGRWMATKSIG